jgi:MFS family permease
MSKKQYQYIGLIPYFMWFIGAAFYFTHYVARVSPSIMFPELMSTFHLTAVNLGGLAASFYFAYIIMQIPSGILIDRFGSRLSLIGSTLICSLSVFLFVFSPNFLLLEFSRFLLGLASAFAFIAAIKLVKQWFSSNRLGMLVGTTQSLGMLGAAMGAAPMEGIVHLMGWREADVLIAIAFFILMLLGIFYLKEKQNQLSQEQLRSSHHLWKGFLTIMANPQTWFNAIYISMLYAPTVLFAEFWGSDFLSRVHDISLVEASFGISLLFIGWAMGSILIGMISDAIKKRKIMMILSAIMTFITMAFILYSHLSLYALYVVMILFGFCNAGVSISYVVAAEINPKKVSATAVAFTNMFSILSGALMQPLVGYLLAWHWSGKIVNHVAFYSASDYQWAMSVLMVCLIISIGVSFFIKETHCIAVE